jgi:hypothetical protein
MLQAISACSSAADAAGNTAAADADAGLRLGGWVRMPTLVQASMPGRPGPLHQSLCSS